MASINPICPKCGKSYAAGPEGEATACPTCHESLGDITTGIRGPREKISPLVLVVAAFGLICALAAIVVLFWFDKEDSQPKKGTNVLEMTKEEENKQAKERVWNDLKEKLPKVPPP